jgi:potassium efflux system protein
MLTDRIRRIIFWSSLVVAGNPVTVSALVVADIDAQLSAIVSRYAGDDPARERLQRMYLNARDLIAAAERHDQVARDFELANNQSPDTRNELRRRLRSIEQRATRQPVSGREKALAATEFEQVYRQAESRRTQLEDALFEIEDQQRAMLDRPDQIRREREAATSRISELELALRGSAELPDNDLANPERTLIEVELVSLRAALRRLDAELLSHSVRLELASTKHDVAMAELEVQERRTSDLRDLLFGRRRDSANSLIEMAKQAQAGATSSHPMNRQIIDETVELGRELSSVIERLPQLAAQRAQLEDRHASLGKEFERAQDRLKYAGYGTGLGHLLIDKRRRIPDSRRLLQGSKIRRETVARIGLRSIELDDQLNDMANLEAEVQWRMDAYTGPKLTVDARSMIGKEMSAALGDQQRLLKILAENYSNYLRTLGDTEFAAQQFAATVESYGDYLDKKITWIPNAPMLGIHMLIDAARAVEWLLSVDKWHVILLDARQGIRQSSLRFAAIMLGIIILFGVRGWLARLLLEIASKVRNIRTDKFRYTLAAIAASLVLASPWAILFGFGATLLRAAHNPSEFSLALAHALWSLAPVVFTLIWLQRLLRENGVGRQHFRWRDWLTVDLRRMTTRLMVTFVPTYFVAVFFEHQDNASYQYGLGRLAFIAAMASVIIYVYRLVHRDGVMIRHLALRYPAALITRFHFLLGSIVLVLPISFALLAAVGYYYTALNLNRHLMQTGVLILVAIVVRSLAMRWLMLAESRLALKRARERRDAGQASSDGAAVEMGEDDIPIDIATINTQTRMMLSNLIGWSFAVGLYFTWQGALPALGVLDSISLWVIEVPGLNGTDIQPITLATVLLAGIIIVVTSIAAKNLPGVLEIGLLQRLPLQPGSRYAITTLSQYAITAVGITIALSVLGARWSQIQWLVAALSVGLGFGLQEIVANFISGLILLFERPIRVGDTVTIGDLTGKVTRIRIRATTIVDWDNKEIVVPNKNFITERFVNWTLSDPVIRVKINIGIAYGSNVEEALKVMYAAANAQDKVLQEPAAQALFLGFGDSSLDFEIQIYIRDLSDRLPVIHGIHMAINDGFAKAEIEIPFPQRDLHVRSISVPESRLGKLVGD